MSNKIDIRFGIMLNGPSLEKWEAETIQKLLQLPFTKHVLTILPEDVPAKKTLPEKLASYPYGNFLFRFYKRFLLRAPCYETVPLDSVSSGYDILYCRTIKAGRNDEMFNEADIDRIHTYQTSFILRFGFGILKGKILTLPTYGLWSFHHADPSVIRGGPAGFWEIFHRMPVSGAVLQVLNEKIDQGLVLQSGFLKTITHSYRANLMQLLHMSTQWPAQVCIRISMGLSPEFPARNMTAPYGKLYRYPGNLQTLNFFARCIRNRISFHFKDVFLAEKWTTGIGRLNINSSDFYDKNSLVWHTALPRGSYLADPFPVEETGEVSFLCEFYSYREGKGKIVASNRQGHVLHNVLESEYHLSYPYTFRYQRKTYCIPEASASGKVCLYVWENQQLRFVNTLLESFGGVDPTLVKYHNQWWLFCTENGDGANSTLHLFYADAPEGPYKPHPLNPVKTDIRNTRPAGNFIEINGKLHRPVQECSIAYGKQVKIMQIEELSTSDFSEKEIVNLPIPHAYSGMHHMAHANDNFYTDGKSYEFSLYHFLHKIRSRIKRLKAKKEAAR